MDSERLSSVAVTLKLAVVSLIAKLICRPLKPKSSKNNIVNKVSRSSIGKKFNCSGLSRSASDCDLSRLALSQRYILHAYIMLIVDESVPIHIIRKEPLLLHNMDSICVVHLRQSPDALKYACKYIH